MGSWLHNVFCWNFSGHNYFFFHAKANAKKVSTLFWIKNFIFCYLYKNFYLIVIIFSFLFRHVRRLRHGGEPQQRDAAPSSSHTTNRQTDHPTDQQSDHQTTEEDESILTEVHVDTGVGVAYFKKGKSYHIKIQN